MEANIYKILTKSQLESFESKKTFVGSEHDIRDGFIHLCTREQVEKIKSRYFSDEKELYIVALDINKVKADLKWDKSSSEETYPHLYKEMKMDDVLKIILI